MSQPIDDLLAAQARIGRQIGGYTIERLIAEGGFGQVYSAYQSVVERHVAIKLIHPQYANQPSFIRRFEVEAQLIAQLEHPHIVPLYDYWRDATGAYLVMRLLRGSLTDLIERQGGPLPLPLASRMLTQIASALTVAHRSGIIHRDLKPANVLLDADDNAYLADFGIAKRLFLDDEGEMEVFGSPAYVAPEQVSGEPIGPQTDIYSLGIILYEMLTGAPPYTAPSQTLLLRQHLTGEIPAASRVRPDLPAAVNDVISRATRRQAHERYPDTLSMARDFQRLIEDGAHEVAEPVSARRGRPQTNSPSRTRVLNVAVVAQQNPYKGLRAFQEADAVDFFGREAQINRLVERLRGDDAAAHLIALVGPSGSGKSSLARAGLLPALRRGAVPGSRRWYIAVMTPGAHPLIEFEQSIGRIANREVQGLAEALRADPQQTTTLINSLIPSSTTFALLIDQFEELFSLTKDEDERAAFLAVLGVLVTSARARIILTLRADYYDRPLLYPEFGALLRDCTEIVLPLTAAEMVAAITQPAERLGVHFETGLTTRIVEDVSTQPGALPLLQFVLFELFDQRRGDTITLRAYDTEGGVFGALARRAESVYRDLDPPSQAAVEKLMLRLIAVGDGTDDARRRIKQSEMNALAADRTSFERAITAFSQARLLTFDRDSRTREPTVEIAHEALIRHWPRFREWIDENRAELRQRQSLSTAAAQWDSSDRDPSLLARGARLAAFEPLAEDDERLLSPLDSAYLKASLRQRQREQQRTRQTIAAMVIITLIAAAAAVIALVQRSDAERERLRADRQARIARAGELSLQARSSLPAVDRALLLSLEAIHSADTFAARRSLLDALQFSPHLRTILPTVSSPLRAVAISPDRRYAAVGGQDGALYIYDLTSTRQPPQRLAIDEFEINAVAFRPDGAQIAAAGRSGMIHRLAFPTGETDGPPLVGHSDSIWALAYGQEGLLASAGQDRAIYLWDSRTGEPLGEPLTDHEDWVYALAFSPDGGTLASAGAEMMVRLWDVETRQALREPLVGHRNWIMRLAFSPDGRLLASGGADGIVWFWDARADFEPNGDAIQAHQDWVRSLAFSPDGRTLATASADHSVRLWDVGARLPLDAALVGHTDAVWDVAALGGDTYLSVGRDAQALVWQRDAARLGISYDAGQPILALTGETTSLITVGNRGADGSLGRRWELNADGSLTATDMLTSADAAQLTAATLAPDGQSLLAAAFDGRLIVWDLSGSAPTSRVLAQIPTVPKTAVYNPNGSQIAAAGDDGRIFIFDTSDGRPVLPPLLTRAETVYALAYSPDGALLASGDDAGEVRLWDAASGEPVETADLSAINQATALAFSPDGTRLAIGTDSGSILLYDLATRTQSRITLIGHSAFVSALDWDGSQRLASASHDGSVRLWEVESASAFLLGTHDGLAVGVRLSADGQHVYSAGTDGRVIAWDLGLETWRARACAIANRSFSADEWARDFPGEPYRVTCSADN